MSPLAAPLIDHADIDLDVAERVTYKIEQSFRYTYDSPVTALSQRLVVVPRRRHGDMHRRAHTLHVAGAAARRRTREDQTGNTVVRMTAAHVDTSIEFRLTAIVERVRERDLPRVPASTLHVPWLHQTTRLTRADDRLRTLAADVVRPGGTLRDIAERVCAAVQSAITYEWGITNVQTTAAEALAGGRGVCQDAAHVMVALCHVARIPVRYVSGHLLGQGGTHAWVEVVVPDGDDAVVLAFDPCNGRRADGRYVPVAVGRDYVDVAPASGSFTGSTAGQLTTSRQVGVVAVDGPYARR